MDATDSEASSSSTRFQWYLWAMAVLIQPRLLTSMHLEGWPWWLCGRFLSFLLAVEICFFLGMRTRDSRGLIFKVAGDGASLLFNGSNRQLTISALMASCLGWQAHQWQHYHQINMQMELKKLYVKWTAILRKQNHLISFPPQQDPSQGASLAKFHFVSCSIITGVPELVPRPVAPFQPRSLSSAFVTELSNDVTTCDWAIDVKC